MHLISEQLASCQSSNASDKLSNFSRLLSFSPPNVDRPLCRNRKTQGFEFCRPSEESAKQFRRILEKVTKLYKKLEILSGGVRIDFASEL